MAICELISNVETISDLLVWPSTCYYYFPLFIIGAIFIIIALSLYNKEKEQFIKSDIISCFGVSSIVMIVLALGMTLIKNSNDIPMLQNDLFLYVIAVGIVFIGIWIFKD